MQIIAEGLLLGLTLAILLGPIFVALTETGLRHGIKAGIAVGSGIWVSDVLVIVASYIFISRIHVLVQDPSFQFWMGAIGGLILIISGIASILKSTNKSTFTKPFDAKSYLGYFTKGFAVNFINPFTFAFWLSVMTTYVMGKGIDGFQTFLLFGTIMLTIMTTDTLKVVLAKLIKTKLKPHHIILFTKIAGIALVIFGLVLMYRSKVFG
ncbi:MAG: LysE family transporter [Saprospiraceae bacterium]|jgi:threonine/homoserine/homoserine lactone efflux protein